MEFMRDFPDDATCLEWLWRNRYSEDGEHAHCPKCERERSFKRYTTKQRRQSWTCTACGHHVQPTAGTIFHNSSTSLHLWFFATHLMTSTKCGVSAKHLERELGVTYKTAWRMCNLIRTDLMAQDDDTTLSGEVEVDETYVGGKQRFQFGRPGRTSKKTPVLAMTERGGKVVANPMPPRSRSCLRSSGTLNRALRSTPTSGAATRACTSSIPTARSAMRITNMCEGQSSLALSRGSSGT